MWVVNAEQEKAFGLNMAHGSVVGNIVIYHLFLYRKLDQSLFILCE